MTGWRAWAAGLRREVLALSLACRHPLVPWYAKLVGAVVVAYALSPVDLIPDFVPVLGYLDDLVLVPLGVLLVRRLVPPQVLDECRIRAEIILARPTSRAGAALVIAIWLLVAAAMAWMLLR